MENLNYLKLRHTTKYYNQDYHSGIRIKQEEIYREKREHRNSTKFCGHLIINKGAKATQ